MSDTSPGQGVIPAQAVRWTSQSVLLDCSSRDGCEDQQALAVIPLVDENVVVGLEIRCGCGASVIVECVYEESQ